MSLSLHLRWAPDDDGLDIALENEGPDAKVIQRRLSIGPIEDGHDVLLTMVEVSPDGRKELRRREFVRPASLVASKFGPLALDERLEAHLGDIPRRFRLTSGVSYHAEATFFVRDPEIPSKVVSQVRTTLSIPVTPIPFQKVVEDLFAAPASGAAVPLVAYASKILGGSGREDEAIDCIQTALLDVYERVLKWEIPPQVRRDEETLRRWVTARVKYAVLSHRRRLRRQSRLEGANLELAETFDLDPLVRIVREEEVMIARDQLDRLERGLAALPPAKREALLKQGGFQNIEKKRRHDAVKLLSDRLNLTPDAIWKLLDHVERPGEDGTEP